MFLILIFLISLYQTSYLINELLAIIIQPLLAMVILLCIPKQSNVSSLFAISATLSNFLLVTKMFFQLNLTTHPNFLIMQQFNFFEYKLVFGIDSISYLLIFLTSFLVLICIYISKNIINFKNFSLYFLFMQFVIYLAWTTFDVFIFYICFESVLIPMFAIIIIWGSRERKFKAAFMFFMYTAASSISMLLSILWIYHSTGTTNLLVLLNTQFPIYEQKIFWCTFFLAFAVKVPVYPLHSWLPEAHVEAPTGGSVFLAGVLLKLGSYGILRFLIPLFPEASIYFSTLINPLCICSIIYASLIALRQNDLKRIIAYSSIAHMNLILLGLFSFNLYGIQGAIFQMISHGLVSGLLFICIGIIYDRSKTRKIRDFSGLVTTMPKFAALFFLGILGNMAYPGTSSFVGEILIFLGIFQNNVFVGGLAATSIVFGSTYNLWLFNRIMFGNISTKNIHMLDITLNEFIILLILNFSILLLGLYPKLIFDFNYINVLSTLSTLLN